ncbi:MAG: tRNA 5-methoxyuridine(34)/uridine 5-oxyacetic acid(34) synthase CmoB [Methylococcales symbiont of Iophon sp. n. MRB-2018]|nr:MAG: tRNA 5-methoxyuridine(34)/uridine 5-oxyacetic acid(34) synthase CmoB [Methylococcales symbiont of Iophon sp. n. MRB-2018]KAF3980616.1 MAG: tRNA 5-methoxyuridine(34)/uridine 5-oxyacetic acid(34) synthase CmoB [Methylococcales symbiont of Iophon sp. n. MRB-2018]
MIDYQPLFQALINAKADKWVEIIPQQLKRAFELNRNGSATQWLEIIANLPRGMASTTDLSSAWVKIGQAEDIDSKKHAILLEQLKSFHPWRKGPYDLFGIKIDTEWRSDKKWDRLKDSITPLNNRLVLDVGCGNGYHCWRMLGVGARMVVGIEPLLLNVLQFQLTRLLHGEAPIYVLPIGLEKIPTKLNAFDSVFSMGVLYHRRSPIDHLLALKDCLRPKGELVLETLVIEGSLGETLLPKGRYAKMRNVWFLPSCETLISWMERCGFKSCRVIDVDKTTLEEQRSTEWMRFHSLKEFLDPDNSNLTCEGLPAPRRVIIVANAP